MKHRDRLRVAVISTHVRVDVDGEVRLQPENVDTAPEIVAFLDCDRRSSKVDLSLSQCRGDRKPVWKSCLFQDFGDTDL